MKGKKGIVFCDIAGTLSFQDKHNNMFDVENVGNGLVKLKDPVSRKYCIVLNTFVQTYTMYTDHNTMRLLQMLKKDYHLVYVTGSRPSSVNSLKSVLIEPHAMIMESGATICLDGYGGVDEEWYTIINAQVKDLVQFVIKIKAEGWILDDKGRTSAVRIFPKENPSKTEADFSALEKRVMETQPSLKTTWNIGGLDIIPKNAGKGNAIKYYMSRLGCSFDKTIGIGDDINDMEMFDIVNERFVVRSSHEEILSVARKNNWYISKGVHFAGINEILELLVKRL